MGFFFAHCTISFHILKYFKTTTLKYNAQLFLLEEVTKNWFPEIIYAQSIGTMKKVAEHFRDAKTENGKLVQLRLKTRCQLS